MAQDTSAPSSQPSEFVIYNEGVKPIKPTHFAKRAQYVAAPPLLKTGAVFGQEYDVHDKFSIADGLTSPSNSLFINALHFAFQHHLPIMLRPDDLWLHIIQGISIHVSENKDKLQTSIVNFADPNTKVKIIVRNDNLVAKDTNPVNVNQSNSNSSPKEGGGGDAEEKKGGEYSNNSNNNSKNSKTSEKDVILESNNINWKSVFDQFSAQCRKICANKGNSGEKEEEAEGDKSGIIDWGVCNFSTSSNICKVASQCALFSVLSNYVKFYTMTRSGIPKIILKGTVDDWKLLRKKCENLETLECDFWYPHLMKTVSTIVESVEKLNDNETFDSELKLFWQSLYHYRNMSGGATVTGWCNDFVPYLFIEKSYQKNRLLGNTKARWGNKPNFFPSSYTKAPMTWIYYSNEIPCDMIGGIVGIQQNNNDGTVAPIIGWMVAQNVENVETKKPEMNIWV